MTPADLRTRRQQLRLTQAELAAHLGVSPTTVARWERGEAPISHMAQTAIESVQPALDHPQRDLDRAGRVQR